jgi:ADP-ribose pyrophosphatase YjhB (NUDIX family)
MSAPESADANSCHPGFRVAVPDGDTRERRICTQCGFVHYDNPRVVVSALATWDGRILLCKRAIEPRIGYWTVPGGFLEVNETTEEGAVRETLEETGARIAIDDLLAVYSLPHIGQVHLVYRGHLLAPDLAPGPESLAAALFALDEVPLHELAFPTNRWAVEHFREAIGRRPLAPFTAPERER